MSEWVVGVKGANNRKIQMRFAHLCISMSYCKSVSNARISQRARQSRFMLKTWLLPNAGNCWAWRMWNSVKGTRRSVWLDYKRCSQSHGWGEVNSNYKSTGKLSSLSLLHAVRTLLKLCTFPCGRFLLRFKSVGMARIKMTLNKMVQSPIISCVVGTCALIRVGLMWPKW